MDNVEYIIIPGTDTKVYENSLVELLRLPDTKWLLQCGTYNYNGVKRKGWYFASKPPGTIIPEMSLNFSLTFVSFISSESIQ